jgi:NADH-quinone oxidoreductase subunit E
VSALSPHILDEIKALPSRYPQPRSAVMPALDLAQEELGYLTPEAMSEVAAALQLDPGYVEGVATFYTLFHLEPTGKHRFYMCTNLSCMLRGAEEVVERLRETIGVTEAGEVSKDGLFSYEEVECMGACEYAPMCRVDHRYHYDLTPTRIDELIRERRESKSGHLPIPLGSPREAREVARAPGGEAQLADASPHPRPSAGTSPRSGEVKRPRRKKTDG